MTLTLDLTRTLAAGGVAGGISAADWAEVSTHAATAHAAFTARREAGVLGFLDLPADEAGVAALQAFAAEARSQYDDVLLLGIGGSSLGAIALRSSLRPWGVNLMSADRRGGWPRVHVLDTPDPTVVLGALDLVDLRRTLVCVVSKSGGTAETLAQYSVVRDRLSKVHGESLTRHLVFVTDPEVGPLRAIARAEGIRTFEVPANVGGRYSVLSAVGLLPAALMGADIGALLSGAAAMAARCTQDSWRENPALAWAMTQWLLHARQGKPIHVLMPYVDALRDIAPWFVQLWAESLGKIAPDGTHVGPTPLAAVGPADQHAQVQLFMEGPADKVVTFITLAEPPGDQVIPSVHPKTREISYLAGHGLWTLVDAEQRATAAALATMGRPSATMQLERLDPWHVGGLLMWLQCATIYAAGLYGINPLDQPGVELGKRYTGALLGRAGTEAEKAAYDGADSPAGSRLVI